MRPGDLPLRRSLGQHHLRRPETATPAVDFLDVAGRTVVEIGPGGGALTGLLLCRGARRVLACELDPLWGFALHRQMAAEPRLRLLVGDACDLAWERLPAAARITGNLPYNVATRIVLRVLERSPVGLRGSFLVQREVAERLTAGPGDTGYGSLSVLAGARASLRRLALVMPGSFVPPPAVTSAFVGIERIAAPVADEQWSDFRAMVRAAFQQRRKTLLNNLGSVLGRQAVAALLADLGLPARVRAEVLGVDEFVALFLASRQGPPPG